MKDYRRPNAPTHAEVFASPIPNDEYIAKNIIYPNLIKSSEKR
jgi:hypothetical protein